MEVEHPPPRHLGAPRRHGPARPTFAACVLAEDDTYTRILERLPGREIATFIEQELEERLGIEDAAIAEEATP